MTKKPIILLGLATTAVAAFALWKRDDPYWIGEYHNNMNLQFDPVFTEKTQEISRDWQGQAPNPATSPTEWSAQWTRTLFFNAGVHYFTVGADDGIKLYIDDQLLIDDWSDHGYRERNANTYLKAGRHKITVQYYQNHGQSRLTVQITRSQDFPIPLGYQDTIQNGDFSAGMEPWGYHRTDCPAYASIVQLEEGPALHLDSTPRDSCWVEAWNCEFARVHPGEKIIVECDVRTGPEGPPPQSHKWGGIGFDIRAVIDGEVISSPIGELSPARIISQEWVHEKWEVIVPEFQKQVWDQRFFLRGRPDKIMQRFGGQGRNTDLIPIGSPMPEEMTLCIWCDLGDYESVEWVEYRNVKVWRKLT